MSTFRELWFYSRVLYHIREIVVMLLYNQSNVRGSLTVRDLHCSKNFYNRLKEVPAGLDRQASMHGLYTLTDCTIREDREWALPRSSGTAPE